MPWTIECNIIHGGHGHFAYAVLDVCDQDVCKGQIGWLFTDRKERVNTASVGVNGVDVLGGLESLSDGLSTPFEDHAYGGGDSEYNKLGLSFESSNCSSSFLHFLFIVFWYMSFLPIHPSWPGNVRTTQMPKWQPDFPACLAACLLLSLT
jgi:hypothetical protein